MGIWGEELRENRDTSPIFFVKKSTSSEEILGLDLGEHLGRILLRRSPQEGRKVGDVGVVAGVKRGTKEGLHETVEKSV